MGLYLAACGLVLNRKQMLVSSQCNVQSFLAHCTKLFPEFIAKSVKKALLIEHWKY